MGSTSTPTRPERANGRTMSKHDKIYAAVRKAIAQAAPLADEDADTFSLPGAGRARHRGQAAGPGP